MDIIRVFDVDFIYFDLIFTSIWIFLLLIRKQFKPLAFGFFGFFIDFIIDYGVWYSLLGTRHIIAPIDPLLFLVYFSFTYGIVQFSFVILLFDGKDNPILWILLLYIGWFFIALMSQYVPWDDREIQIWREMGSFQWIALIMVIVEYAFLLFTSIKCKQKFKIHNVVILFGIGMLTHFALEITLSVAGIRPWDLSSILWNTFIEFNVGIPILYLIWQFTNHKKLEELCTFIEIPSNSRIFYTQNLKDRNLNEF